MATNEEIFQKLEYIASLLEHDLRVGGYEGKLFTLTYKEHTFKGLFLAIADFLFKKLMTPWCSSYTTSKARTLGVKERGPISSNHFISFKKFFVHSSFV